MQLDKQKANLHFPKKIFQKYSDLFLRQRVLLQCYYPDKSTWQVSK